MRYLAGYVGCVAFFLLLMGLVFYAFVLPTVKPRKKHFFEWLIIAVFGFGMFNSMATKPGSGDPSPSPRRSSQQQVPTPPSDAAEGVTSTNTPPWERALAFCKIEKSPTNVQLTAAWPLGFYDYAPTFDLFIAQPELTNDWRWITRQTTLSSATNCEFTITSTLLGLPELPSALFARVTERNEACSVMGDFDDDGVPNPYELYHGTNPYLDDANLIDKMIVGPESPYQTLTAALQASEPYAIIQLRTNELVTAQQIELPGCPVLIEGPRNGYTVIKSAADLGAFMFKDGQSSHTLVRNIYLDLVKRGSFQVGFWCGGNLPWEGCGASPTFENVVVRTPRPETKYIGWLFYGNNGETALLRNCIVNALGATNVRGVETGNGPSVDLDDCSFLNFPGNGIPTLSRTFALGNDGTTNAIVRQGGEATVFVDLTAGVDSDGDGYTNEEEIERLGTDPWLADSDGDGLTDAEEQLADTDPMDVLSFMQGFFIHVTNTTSISGASVFVSYQMEGDAPVPLTNSSERSFDFAIHMTRPDRQLTISAFRDLNENDIFDENDDVIIVIDAPSLSEIARFTFSFGDIDKDGIADDQERQDGTDPYSAQSLRITRTVNLANDDTSAAFPSFYARSSSGSLPQSGEFMQMTSNPEMIRVAANVTVGCAYVFCFRDLNNNGLYDEESDILYRFRVSNDSDDSPLEISLRDADGDTILDGDEVINGTDPNDGKGYCYKPTLIVNGMFATTNNLLYKSYFGTNELGSVKVASSATEIISWQDFLTTTNAERFVVRFFDDMNGNAQPDDGEPCIAIYTPPSGLLTTNTVRLTLGPFDKNSNSVPDWWEVAHGLDDLGASGDWYGDPDNDGVINLHEYWTASDPLVPNDSNTLFSVLASSIDNRLTSTTDGLKNLFDGNYPTLLHPNTNCWAYGIDLTCASPYNSASGRCRAGTAVTDQHIVLANHFHYSSGTRVDFVDTDGQTVSRNVIDGTRIGSTDIYICLLDTPLPPTVHPARLLPPDYRDYLGTGQGLPVLMLDQDEHAIVGELTSYLGNTSPHNPIRQLYHETIISGDSGDPVFLVFENTPILLYTFYSAGGGPSLTEHADEIQSAMNQLSVRNGQEMKSLLFFDFSHFETINGVLQ